MLSVTCLLALLCLLPNDQRDPRGFWEGEVRFDPAVLVRVHIHGAPGALSGAIDIPAQNQRNLSLDVTLEDEEVILVIRGAPGTPTFRGEIDGDRIDGQFSQRGAAVAFHLARRDRPFFRPPAPPFPYRVQDAVIRSGGVRLAGTFSLPDGPGPFPAAVLLSGSGAQDRDSTVFGQQPFLMLADHLTRHGIGVLRLDDRGVGESTGDLSAATADDLAGDALHAIDWLRAQPEIDAQRIGLIGHSEGGGIAPLCASRSARVAFVIMLAGAAMPGDQVIADQRRQLTAGMVTDQNRAAIEAIHHAGDEMVALLKSDADGADFERTLLELYRRQVALQSGAPAATGDAAPAERAALAAVRTRWYRDFVRRDPAQAIAQVRVPLLALNGTLDRQVDAEQNLGVVERALAGSGNPDVTCERLPGLNHLFQPAITGGVEEYAHAEEPMDPGVLERIERWINERFGVRR